MPAAAVASNVPPQTSSVGGLVDLLNDGDVAVQCAAITGLLQTVDHHWHEIAESLPVIEDLASNPRFPQHKAASLLAAKVSYNLELLNDAVFHAMAAEDLFDVQGTSQFSRTIVAMAIQQYCSHRQSLFERAMENPENYLNETLNVANGKSTDDIIDRRLKSLVERMMDDARIRDRSGEIGAIGVALESLRLDKIREIITLSSNPSELLRYCTQRAEETLKLHRFRQLLIGALAEIYDAKLPTSNRDILRKEGAHIAHILFLTNQSDRVAQILHSLLLPQVPDQEQDECDALRAYQIAFDLVSFALSYTTEKQPFLVSLLEHPLLQLLPEPKLENCTSVITETTTSQDQSSSGAPIVSPLKDTDHPSDPLSVLDSDVTVPLLASSSEDVIMEEEGKKESAENIKLGRLRKILNTEMSYTLAVEFLHGDNHADLNLLDQIKNAVDGRSSICQNAIVISHALMQAGTTCDSFLRQNLDWLGKAVCWAKFTAAASTGVLHRGHFQASRQVLSAYLPGSGGGPYSEGGSLYGLGLIHANRFDSDVQLYLLEQLKAAEQTCPQNFEPLQHGACLGLGLMAMSTGDADVYSALREVLFTDSAVAGEAAAIGMGLVAMGSASDAALSELLGYAHDTEHDRIVRGAALGIALCLYRKEDEADPIIDQMARDKEPMIRYAAMFGLGLAYVGTSNSSAVRRLLHVGVSDLSHDVRRAAVISLGFVLCNAPQQIPRIVSLLADSFNPYVRYAAALAVGIGCAGTSSEAAVDLLLPMTQDTTDFVRQGVLLALGLVLVQASTVALPDNKVQKVRDLFVRIAADKHEDGITRFGAIIAQGLIDAGVSKTSWLMLNKAANNEIGRNSTIGFFSATRALRPESSVGFLLFAQLWYWYPLVLAVSLAFRPTALIGLSSDLTVPSDFEIACVSCTSKFAYVEAVPKTKKEEKKEVISAVLSAAQRRKQREQIKRMVTTSGSADMKSLEDVGETDVSMAAKETTEEKKNGDSQSKFTEVASLRNPCRVVPGQESAMRLDLPSSKWVPIDPSRRTGIVMLKRK